MNRIVEIAAEDLSATVQAGVTRTALERAAGEHGLFFPVDPGADATLGGMAATNAAGTTTIRYGKMRANVLALEAVLPDGTVVRTGSRARKTSAGYDLTSLLVGSEGTLAVITEVRVRLYGIPEHVVAQRISFPSVEAACRTAAAVVAAGSAVSRLELLDASTLAAINAYRGSDYPEGPCLLVEAAGTEATVEADLALVRELAEAEGATEIVDERDPTGRAKLWAARHDAAYAMAAASPGRHERATDTCVPVSELAGAVAFARAEVERLGFKASILGHAGDGNLHVSLQLDPDDPAELALADELVERLVVDALARGGTCTGEHGIGQGKIAALELEHGDLVPLMREIKRVFDPLGIMNPGQDLQRLRPGALSTRRRGQLYIAAAAVAWSTAGGLQRELSVDTPTQVAGRAFFAFVALAIFVAIRNRRRTITAFTSMGIAGLGVAVCTAVASGTFIVALNHATVANVLFLQAVSPVAAALLAWVALGESVTRRAGDRDGDRAAGRGPDGRRPRERRRARRRRLAADDARLRRQHRDHTAPARHLDGAGDLPLAAARRPRRRAVRAARDGGPARPRPARAARRRSDGSRPAPLHDGRPADRRVRGGADHAAGGRARAVLGLGGRR